MLIASLLGAIFGFISAIPVAGPISAIIFSQGMQGKYSQARGIALGAALAEAIYAFIALWSFTHFLSHLSSMFEISNCVAAVILMALGIYFFRSKKMRKPIEPHATKRKPRTERSFLIGAGVSAANPSLIATWTASTTTIYSMKLFPFTELNSVFFATGVGAGIFLWFCVLLALISKYRERLNYGVIDKVLKGIGILLIGLSLYMVFRLVAKI
jgi:threonine/homoserine/homoserine lactone efflux protein